MINSVLDPSAHVRQAACYGIGVCAVYGGTPYFEACTTVAIQNLINAIQAPEAREEEHIMATENAISALGKICRTFTSFNERDAILGFWFNSLPIVNDSEEAIAMYSFLLELVEQQHASVMTSPVKLSHVLIQILSCYLLAENDNSKALELNDQLVFSLLTIIVWTFSPCFRSTRST